MTSAKANSLSQLRDVGQQEIARVHLVNLVDHRDYRARCLPCTRQCHAILVAESQRLDHEHDQVRIQRGGGGSTVHRPVQRTPFLAMEPGRVYEGDLRVRKIHQSQHSMPRGLRPGGDDGELLPGECIEQGRLADVRPADKGCESAAMGTPGFRTAGIHVRRSASNCNASAAASCSARRRLKPVPCVAISLLEPARRIEQRTVKVCACGSPAALSST